MFQNREYLTDAITIQELRQHAAALKEEVEKLKADISNIRSCNGFFANETAELKKENEALKADIQTIGGINVDFHMEKLKAEQEIESLRDLVKQKNEHIYKLQQENEQLKICNNRAVSYFGYSPNEKFDELKAENEALKKHITPDYQSWIDDQFNTLRKSLSEALSLNHELATANYDLNETVDRLTRKIENQKTEIKNVTESYHKEKALRKRDRINWGRKLNFDHFCMHCKDTKKVRVGVFTVNCFACCKDEISDAIKSSPVFVEPSEYCEVSGATLDKHDETDCNFCHDKGYIIQFYAPCKLGNSYREYRTPCPHCSKPIETDCANCKGVGKEKCKIISPCGEKHGYFENTCDECNGTGKNQRFLSQGVECIINNPITLKYFAKGGIRTIKDLLDHSHSNLCELFSKYEGNINHIAYSLVNSIINKLGEHGLKLKE